MATVAYKTQDKYGHQQLKASKHFILSILVVAFSPPSLFF